MIQKVHDYMNQLHMVSQNDVILVGVSGGADSICLLEILHRLQPQVGYQLKALHVNHMIRGEEALHDEEYVKAFCSDRSIELYCEHIDVPQMSKELGMTLEEAGRKARYDAFEQVEGVTKIAVAHHENDQAETVLFNMARGSSLRGIGGIRPIRGRIIRPMLCLSRAEIEDFLTKEHISYCIDSTNLTEDYSRNALRNQILPEMVEKINVEAVSNICKAAADVEEAYQYIYKQAKVLYDSACDKGSLKCELLLNADSVIRRQVIRMTIHNIVSTSKDITRKHIELVEQLLWKNVSAKIQLPYGLWVERGYTTLDFYVRNESSLQKAKNLSQVEGERDEKGLFYGDNETFFCSKEDILFNIMDYSGDWENLTNDYTKVFNYDIIKGTLITRKRQPGDYIVVDSKGSRKSLKSYMIDQKIPQKMRDSIWVIAEGSNVLWILGQRSSAQYYTEERTQKIVVVSIRRNSDGI